jgi:hypothetical protein
VGNLTTSSNYLNAGNATLTAVGNVTTGAIATSTPSGQSGAVAIAADSATVETIDTSSSTGTGGDIDISVTQTFQAVSTLLDGSSLNATGGTQGGAITIAHGGGIEEIPLTIQILNPPQLLPQRFQKLLTRQLLSRSLRLLIQSLQPVQ